MEKIWRVIYTRPRWEKKIDRLLESRGIESYCPMVKSERQWSDRKKIVELPLFSSYVFVCIKDTEQSNIRQTPGVVNFVYYLGKPATVSVREIAAIQLNLQTYEQVETVSLQQLKAGEKVKIVNGALCDQEGTIVRIEGKKVLMVLEQLGSVILARVPVTNISIID